MKTLDPSDERYYGVEIKSDGRIVVAERLQGKPVLACAFPSGTSGAQALRRHIERECAHPHVCIKARGALGLALTLALIPMRGAEVTLVASHALQTATRTGSPEETAAYLAKLAERLS
ncbi:MAG TPA: hypothetical protein VNE59_10815 [Burkholderiales bacterium]|nr:hypothetical protein [Burkholderiales bacterium]